MERDMMMFEAIAREISRVTGRPFRPESRQSVAGGCISASAMLQGGGCRYFIKLNEARRLDMFAAEAAGLSEITQSGSVRVPEVICWGVHADRAYLVLEHLDLGHGDNRSDALLGGQLAEMHRTTRPRHGWVRDNTIGSTPQINAQEDDWIRFYREHRLRYQLDLAGRNGYGGNLARRGELLLEKLPVFFHAYKPQPSLLHGDLWGGNYAVLRDGTPVIFDPAVYYGDRETDLAMTELFGGFGSDFYHAYREVWPLDPGYRVRKDLYNLYHVLNHLNLFGGGYRGQAEQLIGRLLGETG
jgi:protein-ribulosamine 3-kinase